MSNVTGFHTKDTIGAWLIASAKEAVEPTMEFSLAKACPALRALVMHPVRKRVSELSYVIISLNDKDKWTRDQIAEWLETLDLDLSFRDVS